MKAEVSSDSMLIIRTLVVAKHSKISIFENLYIYLYRHYCKEKEDCVL